MPSSFSRVRLSAPRYLSSAARQVLLLAIGCAQLQSCGNGPTPPSPPVFVEAQLDSIWFEPFYEALQDFGVFVVMGAPTDTSFRLAENARLRLEVTTSGGDSEDFAFQRYICPPGNRDCTGLAVLMKDGHHASQLNSALDGNTARLYSVSISGRFAGIRVFDMRAVQPTLPLLSKNPGVSSASRGGLG